MSFSTPLLASILPRSRPVSGTRRSSMNGIGLDLGERVLAISFTLASSRLAEARLDLHEVVKVDRGAMM